MSRNVQGRLTSLEKRLVELKKRAVMARRAKDAAKAGAQAEDGGAGGAEGEGAAGTEEEASGDAIEGGVLDNGGGAPLERVIDLCERNCTIQRAEAKSSLYALFKFVGVSC